ncbi:hypothetical protein KI387_008444 [Taxus chinensis]|uniref:Uncharacterized protein n=1 Tax=Taxus chinensis TaxID=29808 RepID=A0AA38CPE0_TAXCH|nr:hypothetical protein KI387_008444 [Taxus chinensis]
MGVVGGIVILAVMVAVVYKLVQWKRYRLPPGPRGLPIVGNLLDIGAVRFRCFSEWSKQYGPIMSMWFGSTLNVIVCNTELAKEVLKEHDQQLADRPRSRSAEKFYRNGQDLIWADNDGGWMACVVGSAMLGDRLTKSIMKEHTLARQKSGAKQHFVDALLTLQEKYDLSEDVIIGILCDMITAGIDTIAITLEWAMTELVHNPRVQQKAQEELDRVIGKDRVLNETGHFFLFTASRTSNSLPETSPNALSGTELLPA